MNQNSEDGDGDAGDDRAIDQDQGAGGHLRGGLFQLEGLGIERLMPPGEGPEKTSAALEGIGQPPLEFAGIIQATNGDWQLDTVFQPAASQCRSSSNHVICRGFGGEGEGFDFGDLRVEQHREHGREVALQTLSFPGR